jgi:Uma2 family endonuclease
MVAALELPPERMTVAEFLTWDPGDGSAERWCLRDGVPELMAPASDVHGTVQARLAYLLTAHFERQGSPCRAVTAPGVVPRERSEHNMLSPDLAVACEPLSGHAVANPRVLVEILSPSNASETHANVRAFMSIPSVMEIVVLHSTRIAGEVWRRGTQDWPTRPDPVGADADLRLDSIGFVAPLRAIYRTSGLT